MTPPTLGGVALWKVECITLPKHPRHPQFTVCSVECCEDPDDGMPPMPYALFVEGICREEADRICDELNRARANPRAMVEPRHLAAARTLGGAR